MSGDLSQIIPLLAGALAGVEGVVTVLPYLPEQSRDIGEVPALLLDVGPPTTSVRSNVREVSWPIEIWALITKDHAGTATLEDDIAACLPFPERIIARLDACRTFNGVLAKTIAYAEPALSGPLGGAFSPIAWKDAGYVGTVVHAVCTVERQGGF